MDKVIANLDFPRGDLERRMGEIAKSIAKALDYLHTCNDGCQHKSTLHVRVNDVGTGKGIDQFFAVWYQEG